MWSQRDPTMRKTGLGNVFIKNLDPKITHKELYDTFSEFGNILSCKVALNEHGESKGYGFVHFEFQKSADSATQKVNDTALGIKKVYVGAFLPRKVRDQKLETSWTNVFVKDIDPEVTDNQFEQAFAAYGRVTSPLVVRKDGQPSFYGFVNFENHEDAVRAVEGLNGSKLGNKQLFCCRAQKKRERMVTLRREWEKTKSTKYQGVNLYIKHIEDEIDEERLLKEFSAYGNVVSHKIMSEEGVSKGFGFVCFSNPDEAMKASLDLNGRVLPGCSKPLYVALHETKEVRRSKLASAKGAPRAGPPTGMVHPATYAGQPVFLTHPYHNMMQQVPQQRSWGPQGYPLQTHFQPTIAPARGTRGGRGGGGNRGGPRQAPRNQVADGTQFEFSPQSLSQFPFEQQKLMLGERLYPLIEHTQPELAGKITGMFLDSGWSIEELYSLLVDNRKLAEKIEDAVNMLKTANLLPEQPQ